MLFTVDNEAGKITCLCQVPQVRAATASRIPCQDGRHLGLPADTHACVCSPAASRSAPPVPCPHCHWRMRLTVQVLPGRGPAWQWPLSAPCTAVEVSASSRLAQGRSGVMPLPPVPFLSTHPLIPSSALTILPSCVPERCQPGPQSQRVGTAGVRPDGRQRRWQGRVCPGHRQECRLPAGGIAAGRFLCPAPPGRCEELRGQLPVGSFTPHRPFASVQPRTLHLPQTPRPWGLETAHPSS